MILDLPQPEIAFFNESDLIFVCESKFLLPNYNVMLSLWLFENGNIDGKYDAHLHISFKIVSKDTILKEIINGKEGKKLVIGEHYKKLSVCNPFHNESKKSPNKKGILYEN